MAIQIKDTGTLADKYKRRVSGAGNDYLVGVQNPRRDQNAEAIAAADRWLAGVTAAGEPKFVKGLRRAGEEKWTRKASTVGKDRFPTGAAAAAPDWQAGVEPILSALRSATLPPRGLKRSPQNVARVAAVIDIVTKAADARA